MGGNLIIILTTISLNQLLESILGKLNNERIHSEIMIKFQHKLHKNMLHVFILLHEWLPPYDSC